MTVSFLPEWQFPTGDCVDERQDQQPVDAEAEHHHEEVPAELLELGANVFHLEELPSHQEADSNGSEVDDPSRDPHHHDAAALEELQQRFAVLSRHGDGDAQDDTEDDQAQLGGDLDENLKQNEPPEYLQCWRNSPARKTQSSRFPCPPAG